MKSIVGGVCFVRLEEQLKALEAENVLPVTERLVEKDILRRMECDSTFDLTVQETMGYRTAHCT